MRHTQAPLEPELIAAIVEEAKTGEGHRSIAARLGVSKYSVWKYANLAGISNPRPKLGAGRVETLCLECGSKCWSKRGVCRLCWSIPPTTVPDETAALTGGRWVPNGRGVMVWEADIEHVDYGDQESAA